MDSIERCGVRIEIQALMLSKFNLIFKLTNDETYKKLEEDLRKKVKEKFWNGNFLADGLDDFTIRPNLFIAAYIYPNLLSKDEWKKCFENVLPKLWLEWGGLSTIDKSSDYFCDTYSGEIPKSYHNGDSWFWVNNLVALVLFKIDEKKFKKYIDKILSASTYEILWKGFIGCHTEITSAKELMSEGCLDQTWSSAMYVELVDEVFTINEVDQ
jgi:glycogen debranching enzyme